MGFLILLLMCREIPKLSLLGDVAMAAEPFERPPLLLGVGEQRLLRIPGLSRFSLGSGAVRVLRPPSIGPDPGRASLLVKGVQPGQADLWVWKTDGGTEHRSIRVEKVKPRDASPELLRSLGELSEVEVFLEGSGALLRGEVQSIDEAARILALARQYPRRILDQTELSDALLSLGLDKLQAWLERSGYAGKLRLERAANQVWVRGAIENTAERGAIERKLRALFPPVKIEIDSLSDNAPTVYFRVFLLELKRNRFGTLGLDWPAEQESAFRVSSGSIRDLLQLDLTLHALEGNGSARVLSNPELAVRAPGEAELFAGGELPIRAKSQFYSNVTWKTYGLTLRLKVKETAGNRVRLEIFTEVSRLDLKIAQVTSNDLPGIQSNRMKTEVDARYGVPLLLSGLLQDGNRKEVRGLPFLKSIPVLGKLFGSEDYLNDRSELVAILLPRAVPPEAPLTPLASRWALFPRGRVPPPRNWVSPSEERALRGSPDFPWNALR